MSNFKRKAGDPCPYCGEPLQQEMFDKRKKETGAKIKEGLRQSIAAGRLTGAPRMLDWDKIYSLSDEGYSTYAIAEKMDCSRSAVQNALEKRRHM